jgi:hypothetical protein
MLDFISGEFGKKSRHLGEAIRRKRRSQIRVPEKPSAFSSARTTKRFPSPRCASTIQIVRLWESMAEMYP